MNLELKPLNELGASAAGLIRRFRGGKDFVNRMATLGFTAGAEVRVVQNYSHGPVIVVVRDVQIALGRGEAAKVLVEVIGKA